MQLKQFQIVNLFQVLSSLDGATGATPDGKPTNVSNFKFKASVIYALAKNLRRLKSLTEDVEQTRVKLVKKYQETPDQEKLSDTARKQFLKEYDEFLQTEIDVNFHKIKEEDLDLDTNKVPVPIIAELLGTIIEEATNASNPAKQEEKR